MKQIYRTHVLLGLWRVSFNFWWRMSETSLQVSSYWDCERKYLNFLNSGCSAASRGRMTSGCQHQSRMFSVVKVKGGWTTEIHDFGPMTSPTPCYTLHPLSWSRGVWAICRVSPPKITYFPLPQKIFCCYLMYSNICCLVFSFLLIFHLHTFLRGSKSCFLETLCS